MARTAPVASIDYRLSVSQLQPTVHPTTFCLPTTSFADTAIWRAVMPQPNWWPSDPGSYCIWGTPPNTVLAFSLNGGMLAWQVPRLAACLHSGLHTRMALANP